MSLLSLDDLRAYSQEDLARVNALRCCAFGAMNLTDAARDVAKIGATPSAAGPRLTRIGAVGFLRDLAYARCSVTLALHVRAYVHHGHGDVRLADALGRLTQAMLGIEHHCGSVFDDAPAKAPNDIALPIDLGSDGRYPLTFYDVQVGRWIYGVKEAAAFPWPGFYGLRLATDDVQTLDWFGTIIGDFYPIFERDFPTSFLPLTKDAYEQLAEQSKNVPLKPEDAGCWDRLQRPLSLFFGGFRAFGPEAERWWEALEAPDDLLADLHAEWKDPNSRKRAALLEELKEYVPPPIDDAEPRAAQTGRTPLESARNSAFVLSRQIRDLWTFAAQPPRATITQQRAGNLCGLVVLTSIALERITGKDVWCYMQWGDADLIESVRLAAKAVDAIAAECRRAFELVAVSGAPRFREGARFALPDPPSAGYDLPVFDAWQLEALDIFVRQTDARVTAAAAGDQSTAAPVSPTPPQPPPINDLWKHPDVMLTHVEIAKRLGVDPEVVRKRLDRWRSKHTEGWEEVANPKSKEPRYLYRVGSIQSAVDNLAGKTSGNPSA